MSLDAGGLTLQTIRRQLTPRSPPQRTGVAEGTVGTIATVIGGLGGLGGWLHTGSRGWEGGVEGLGRRAHVRSALAAFDY